MLTRTSDQTQLFDSDSLAPGLERVDWLDASTLVRQITRSSGIISTSILGCNKGAISSRLSDMREIWDLAWLQSQAAPETNEDSRKIVLADLFCGCGGLTLGIQEACRGLSYGCDIAFANDIDEQALAVYKRNFNVRHADSQPIQAVFPGEVGDRLLPCESRMKDMTGPIDFLVGGPPCQGHSDLNNHTRRDDPKNALYMVMARAAEVLRPRFLIIENVPSALHDRNRIVQRTDEALRDMGYATSIGIMRGNNVGVPQGRKRCLLLASREGHASLDQTQADFALPVRTVSWAIGDLLDKADSTVYDSSSRHSDVNQSRIDFLFDHDIYDLPNSQRPDCHRLKTHSYTSVYGRMRWDAPSQTVTTGFGSTGQGRFVHPLRRRTITPHEAARLQFFPDWFDFSQLGRRQLQKFIGNAVPSKFGYITALELMR
jgi:DNA (cytosine-5)-methyltransferase 1